jgi:predicted ABC-type ATPase
MSPRLQIIRGLPGSGKSTLALKRYPNLLRLETDFIYESGGRYEFSKEKERLASWWLDDAVNSATSCGMDFVCSSVYPKLSGRLEVILARALASGYDIYIHSMPVDVNYGNVHDVPHDVMMSMKDSFESDETLWGGMWNRFPNAGLENRLHFGLMPGKDK